jgi:hypothetical protein
MLTWDIETDALPDEQLRAIMPPFDEAKYTESFAAKCSKEFDPASVKVGNIKDEAKKQEKIAAARSQWEYDQAEFSKQIARLRDSHESDFRDGAALSALTGRVLVIGFYSLASDKVVIIDGKGDEAEILAAFWKTYIKYKAESKPMIGLNIHDFDLPFLVRRSWLLDVEVPAGVIDGRYWCKTFVDLRRVWQLGQHPSTGQSSFDVLGQAFGTGGKNGRSGKDFAKLWREDRPAAIAYLTEDLKQPAIWARRMRVIV